MKVTLSFSAYINPINNSSIAYTNGLPCANNQPRPASQQAAERPGQHVVSWGCWVNEQRGPAVAHQYAGELPGLITASKPHLLKTHPYSAGLSVIPTLKTTPTPPALVPAMHYSDSPDIWLFCSTAQYLCNSNACIQLTAIESLLIKTLTQRDERICSKQELIIGINKDTHSYSGLEMCLSRLQNKFKGVFGERLFRSVRNRGYCLVQDVQIAE